MFYLVKIEPVKKGDRMYYKGDRLELEESVATLLLDLGVLKLDLTPALEPENLTIAINKLTAEDAIALIKSELSLDKLSEWLATESRKTVKTAIEQQIAVISQLPTDS
jgi:predicted Zn-dependent peptidase